MKKIVCCISCAAIIGISVFYAGRLLQPNFTVDAFHAIESFHSMPENSFDVIACGSSHVYKGLNVNEMTERYGFSAYNYGCNWQFLNTTTLFFEDALRTQSPKVILIETFNVDKVHEDTDLNGEIYYTKGISDFKGKREYLAQCFGKNKDRYLSYYIPLLAFHENWTNVNYYSFDSGTSVEEYQAAHGFSGSDHIVPTVISNPATFEQKELPDSSVRLLDKIVNICMKIIFVLSFILFLMRGNIIIQMPWPNMLLPTTALTLTCLNTWMMSGSTVIQILWISNT